MNDIAPHDNVALKIKCLPWARKHGQRRTDEDFDEEQSLDEFEEFEH